jgi:D-galactarolactone cycloisomerase
MKITEVKAASLRSGTPEGGWSNEIRREDCVHTLSAVFTDEGVTGWGSVFTNDELVKGYVLLRQSSAVKIAGGEVLTRRQSFTPWLQKGPSTSFNRTSQGGGDPEERRIAWMAEENGVRFIPHGWNTALGLAADLQLVSASRGTDMMENLTGSPFN